MIPDGRLFSRKDTLTILAFADRTEEPFEFPQEAYNIVQNDFWLYFQVHLDFSEKLTNLS